MTVSTATHAEYIKQMGTMKSCKITIKYFPSYPNFMGAYGITINFKNNPIYSLLPATC